MNKNKAEIIGLLCAEGNYHNKVTRYLQYYSNRNKYYYVNHRNMHIQFGNTNPKLLNQFHRLLQQEYNYSPKIYKDRIKISRRDIIRDLIQYSDYGTLKWQVPKEVSNKRIFMINFLRGYFEGDGCSRKNKIVFSSANLNGLKEVRKLLECLSIKNTLQGPYFRKNKEPEYFVYIKAKSWDKFFGIIKPKFKFHPDICREMEEQTF